MWVAGWNREQNQTFTVESLADHIQYNLDAFHANTSASVAMLGLFATKEEANALCEELKTVRNARLEKR